MKKIRGTAATLLFLLFFVPVSGFSQKIDIDLFPLVIDSTLHLDIRVLNLPEDEIRTALDEGFRSELLYTIQVYRENSGVFSVLGDRLIMETTPVMEAGRDVFEQNYYIIDHQGIRRVFRDKNDFFYNLSRIINYTADVELEEDEEYYIMTNLQISPVKLTPPLTIIQLFMPQASQSTPWFRVPLVRVKGR